MTLLIVSSRALFKRPFAEISEKVASMPRPPRHHPFDSASFDPRAVPEKVVALPITRWNYKKKLEETRAENAQLKRRLENLNS
jgi:hypothetical protein